MRTGKIMGPVAQMAGCPWNVLDSTGSRIALCGGDSHTDYEAFGSQIAAQIVTALNERYWLDLLPSHPDKRGPEGRTEEVLDAIAIERSKHSDKGFDAAYDATNSRNDWVGAAVAYIGRAAERVPRNEREGHNPREMLVKAAAILVAAIEDLDNKKAVYRDPLLANPFEPPPASRVPSVVTASGVFYAVFDKRAQRLVHRTLYSNREDALAGFGQLDPDDEIVRVRIAFEDPI